MSTSDFADVETPILLTLYETGRAETNGLLGHALTLINVAVAYLVGVVAALMAFPEEVPPWLVPILPLPTISAAAFHVILNGVVQARTATLDALEDELLGKGRKRAAGNEAGTAVTDIPSLTRRGRRALGASMLIAYGGAGLVIVVFTCLSLGVAFKSGEAFGIAMLCSVVYAVSVAVIASAWATVLGIDWHKLVRWSREAS